MREGNEVRWAVRRGGTDCRRIGLDKVLFTGGDIDQGENGSWGDEYLECVHESVL